MIATASILNTRRHLVCGRAVDYLGQPVRRALVEIRSEDGQRKSWRERAVYDVTRTDDYGCFLIRGIPDGRFVLAAYSEPRDSGCRRAGYLDIQVQGSSRVKIMLV